MINEMNRYFLFKFPLSFLTAVPFLHTETMLTTQTQIPVVIKVFIVIGDDILIHQLSVTIIVQF